MNRKINPILSVLILLNEWLIEVSAFILLPLLIYIITFITLGRPAKEIVRLPELMFISIILYGEILKRSVIFYRQFRGFELKLIRMLSVGLLGISVSGVLLCFSLVAQHRPDVTLSKPFYFIQGFVFLTALLTSAFLKVWLGMLHGEPSLYMHLIKETLEVKTVAEPPNESDINERALPPHEQ
jgi:hypothetical protein